MNERTLRTLEYEKVRAMVAERVACSLGRELAERLEPTNDLLEARRRQRETTEAVSLYRGGKSVPLGGIHSLRVQIVRAAKGGMLEPHELLDVADTCGAGRKLKRFLLEHAEGLTILPALANMISPLQSLEAEIRQAITEQGEVSDNASPALAQVRKAQRGIQSRIRDRVDAILRGPAARYLQDPIVSLRDDRYVIPVRVEYKSQVPGIVHDMSGSGATLWIEPQAVVELNNELKELALQEREEVARILQRLSGLVAEAERELVHSQEALAQIDFACAKARLSLELHCVEPELNNQGWLEIRKGRHPLLKGSVVPVDIHLGRTFDTLVITGPNTGGKTVTLKTVGLFVVMAQAGLHLPASYGTEISLFDQVFVDVGDEQSIEQSLSTFSSHMSNIVRILQEIDGRALVLLDELGAGTDPTEGAALGMSILEHLHARGAKTIATTHYSELKTFAFTRPRVENASVEFDLETLRPTYRLLIGMPGRSQAFEISERLGLAKLIVERARGFLTKQEERVESLIQGIHETRSQLEKERQAASEARAQLQALKEEYEQKTEEARRKAAETAAKAQKQASDLVAATRREAEEIIAELKRALQEQRDQERHQAIAGARQRLQAARDRIGEAAVPALPRRPEEIPIDLKPGEAVEILSLGQKGFVLAPPDAGGQVPVQAGILKVTVSVADLQRVEPAGTGARSAAQRSPGRSLAMAKAQEMPTEVDLRGLTVDEALEKVEKYLDDAVLSGIPQVRIIHGKGTGVLRKAIAQYLKTNRYIESHRLGGLGEGGDGVTVAKMKG
jgi:DNA mismatch repair protein MutS2